MNHLRFLRYVDEVARVGSVRQAAERLRVAPSAVIRRIQDLEQELGTPIFERLPRGMRLTSAGEIFVAYIRQRMAALERTRSEIEDLQGMRRGLVRVVASQALAPVFLPQAIASFRKIHPYVEFQVAIGDRAHALHKLREFASDLALVFNLAPESDVEHIGEYAQKLVATMHRSHPLANRSELRLRDCADYPLALPNRDTGGRLLVERFLARSSVRFRAVLESNSVELLRGYLHYEKAVSFQLTVGGVSDDGEIMTREISDRGFPRGTLVLAHLRNRQLPVVAHEFARHLQHLLETSALPHAPSLQPVAA